MSEPAPLATLLARLRRTRTQQSGLDSSLLPHDTASAYETAAHVAAQLGWPVGGWKIAATNTDMQRALRTDAPIYGRVYASNIVDSPTERAFAPLLSPIPEVEFQLRLGRDLPPRDAPYTEAEVDAAVASLHPGIELAECRFIHDEHFPPLPAILADGAGSGTLIVGPAVPDWRARDIANQEVVLYRNGQRHRAGTALASMQHPLKPLTWLANELSRTGVGLRRGDVVSTGTLTGMFRPARGDHYLADFGPLGQVELTLT